MAAAFTPFAPLAVNAAGQALGFLGQVCDKAKGIITDTYKTVKENLDDKVSVLNKVLDGDQFGLDVVGMIPILGDVCDGINAVVSLARGDYVGAALSAAAMIPLAGSFLGATKVGMAVAGTATAIVKNSDMLTDVVRIAGKAADFVKPVLKNAGDFVAKNLDNVLRNAGEAIGKGLSGIGGGLMALGTKGAKEGLEAVAEKAGKEIGEEVVEATVKKADDLKVIGRLEDTGVAKDWAGHDVLDLPDGEWTITKNQEWVNEGIKNGQDFYVASPMTGENFVSKNPNYPGLTVFGQEVNMLEDAGYKLIGDTFVSPTNLK